MADPTTELAKEFLELHDYVVRKETKFYKNKFQTGVPSDIDILATRPQDLVIDGLKLRRNIVAEVKNWEVRRRSTIDDIYRSKFMHIDKLEVSWRQLRRFFPNRRFDRVLFCQAVTENVADYAERKYRVKVVTTGFMIRQLADFFRNDPRRWSYYPEWYNYNLMKNIMYYLFHSYSFKDKLRLEDIVWIDPKAESQLRNKFVEENWKFMEDLITKYTYAEVLESLFRRVAKDEPVFFKRALKSNKKFWKYLTIQTQR